MRDLSASGGIPTPNCETYEEASAWIEYFFLWRRLDALRKLQPNKGDVVLVAEHEEELEEVASIGKNGALYFKGGRSRAWPDTVPVSSPLVPVMAENNGHTPVRFARAENPTLTCGKRYRLNLHRLRLL